MSTVTEPIQLPKEGPSSWRDSFAALAVPNFRIFAGANVVAMTATWMQRIAQDWLVLQLTGSVAMVGITTLLQFGPMLVFGLYGGVIVDRYPKRILLMITQGSVGLLSVLLAVLVLTGAAQVWMVWGTALAIGFITVVDNPARQVFANELVGPRHLRNAITLNSSTFQLGGLIGPAVSGALIAAVGGGWAFAINAVACASTVFALTRLDPSKLHRIAPAPRSKGQLREGLAYAAAKPTIRYPVILCAFLASFALTMPVLLAAYANDVFDIGAGGYGLLNSLVAVGALTGALASTRRKTLRLRTVIVCGGIWAVIQASAGFMPTLVAFGLVLVASGFANQFFFMAGNPLVQMSTNTAIRGRVMAVWVLVLLGGQALGGPIMGFIVGHFGAHVGMVLSGLVPATAAAVIAVVIARRNELTLSVRWRHVRPRVAIHAR